MRAYGFGDLGFGVSANCAYVIYQLERAARNAGRVGEPIRLTPLSLCTSVSVCSCYRLSKYTHTHSCTPIALYVRVSYIFLAIL